MKILINKIIVNQSECQYSRNKYQDLFLEGKLTFQHLSYLLPRRRM